ncbi:MAG: type II secretion system protein [Rickettsiales bacterium]
MWQPSTIRPRPSAFSLVELSIVLVILGLLVGGILSGQALIRAAELRSVTTEYQRYYAASQAFRDKYFAIPGDMTNATRFWGNLGGVGCVNNAGTASVTTGTCDGNGDGFLNTGGAVSQTGEMFQFWRQLATAGLIEGQFSGIAGGAAGWTGGDSIVGTNVPRARLQGGGWTLYSIGVGVYPGNNWTYAMEYGNLMHIGAPNPGTVTEVQIIRPEEAWNIDTKMDDGKPGTGKIIAKENGNFTLGVGVKCTTSTSQTDYAGLYSLTNTTAICGRLMFPKFI